MLHALHHGIGSKSAQLALAATALFSMAACGAADEAVDSSPYAAQEAPIVHGESSGAEDDATVWLAIIDQGGRVLSACTGVLVAPNLVLTARHCVSKVEESPIACDEGGRALLGGKIYEDFSPSQIVVQTGAVLKREVHARGTRIFREDRASLCNSDIALVLLDRQLPEAKVAPVRLERPPSAGDQVTVVGWGLTASPPSGGLSNSEVAPTVRQRRRRVPVLAVGANHQLSMASGDREFATGESVCSGDSGGPAFDEQTGAVVGVVARGGGGHPYDPETEQPWVPCVDAPDVQITNVFSRTDAFGDLFQRAFEAAGTTPVLEKLTPQALGSTRVVQQATLVSTATPADEPQTPAAGCTLGGVGFQHPGATRMGPWLAIGFSLGTLGLGALRRSRSATFRTSSKTVRGS